MFVVGGSRAEDGIFSERDSIEQSDVFGVKAMEDAEDHNPYPTDPITEYLRHLAEEYGAEHIKVLQENMTDEYDPWGTRVQCGDWSWLGYSINPAELDRLAGDER